MSKFSDSTFYLAPSGYRETILFPQKPLSSIGQLSVTRASSATRTNPAGQVEEVCYNLLQYSEDFSNAIWQKTATTVSANSTTAPNGTTTADSLIPTTSNEIHRVSINYNRTSGVVYTLSVYAKASGYNFLYMNANVLFNAAATFNLSNGTISGGSSIATITDVGNGWYRCSITGTASVSGSISLFLQTNSTVSTATDDTFTGNGTSGIFFWGAQLVQGNLPKDYLYTSDRLNFPRVDYSDGSASFLLEPQRTNSIRNSIASGAVAGNPGTTPTNWSAIGTSLGITRSISAVGTENGLSYIDIKFEGTATSTGTINTRFEQQSQIAASNGQAWTLSTYIKNVSGTVPTLTLTMGERSSSAYVKFATQNITTDTSLNRYVYSRSIDGGATVVAVDVFLDLNIVNGQTYDFVIRIAQPQMELGAFATTPIFTLGSAAVTRLADTFTRNNIFTNNLISSSGGTWFVELKNSVIRTRDMFALIGIGDTVLLDTNSLVLFPSTRFSFAKYVSGTPTPLTSTSTDTAKVLFKWNGSTADIFVNGTKVISATAFTATNLQFIATASIGVPIFITQMALWNTPLSDSQCVEITGVAYTTPAQAYGSLNLVSESPDCLYTSVNTINRI